MKALSIQQPWALFIVRGLKPVENRTWSTNVRGRILIHAGRKFDFDGYIWLKNNWHRCGLPGAVGDICDLPKSNFPCGGIVGAADLVDCVERHESPWFNGPFGFVLANAEELPLRPLRGALQFFEVPA